VVAVNKMDLVDYSREVFDGIRAELGAFLGQLGITPDHFVPISAKLGEGVVRLSDRMPWYTGPSLLESLQGFHSRPAPDAAPLRFSVQDIYRFDARRIVAGVVEAGLLSVGDSLEFCPGGKQSRVKSIESWPASADGGRGRDPVPAGRVAAITLQDELFVERGQVGAPPDAKPVEAHEFTARLFWLHNEPLRIGDVLPLRIATQQAETTLLAIERVLDAVTLESQTRPASEIRRHEVAQIRLRVRRPIAFDPGGSIPALGRFVLLRGRRIAGGGVIDSAHMDEPAAGSELPIKLSARTAMLGHRGAVVWLTGFSGSGKSTLAGALEKELFRMGVLPTVLDGDVLRTGLCRGLGFSPEDRKENMRRAAEAALLLARTGSVVITALISPFREDRRLAAELCRKHGVPFAEVFVNAPLAECERRDPKQLYQRARAGQIPSFTGIDSPYEAPLAPDLELRTDREAVEQSVEKLSRLVLNLARPSSEDPGGDI
jgi:bifunctional enzyme CysN/CysC